MNFLKKPFLLTFGAFMSINAYGQEAIVVSDFESWSSISAEKSLGEKFSFEISQQLRLKQNSTKLHNTFTHLSLDYKLAKGLKLGVGYRYLFDKDGDDYERYRRLQADIKYKHNIERFNLSYRLRIQNKKQKGSADTETTDSENGLRLKIGVGYNIRKWKWDPVFSTELFRTKIGNYSGEFEKIRLTLGTKYKVKKIGVFTPYYRIEREFNGYLPKTTYILGLNFKFNL